MRTRAGLAREYLAKGFWEGTTVAQALGRAVRDHWRRVALVRGWAKGLGWPGAGA